MDIIKAFKIGNDEYKINIKKGSLVRNKYYFDLFKNCCPTMQADYMTRVDSLPVSNSPGLHIEQLDINTQVVLKTYNSMSDVLKVFCISRKTLKDACEKELPCKGFLWRIV